MAATADTPTPESEDTIAATAFRSELPANRPKPRAFGAGRYGVSKYDDRDNTRYAWARVVPAVTALALALFAAPAHAVNSYCEGADSATSYFAFCKPDVNEEGANRWGDKMNENMGMIEDALLSIDASTSSPVLTALSASTVAIQAELDASQLEIITASTGSVATGRVNLSTVTTAIALKVSKAGDTMTGTLTGTHVAMSSAVFTTSVGISSAVPTQALVVIGSQTTTGEIMTRGTTAWGRITSAPSATAIAGLDFSWNGHGASNRDDASVAGTHMRIMDAGRIVFGNEVDDGFAYDDGGDGKGHIAVGWGDSSPRTALGSITDQFSINAQEGYLAGFNGSGNTKLAGTEGLAIEDASRANILLANTSGRAWRMSSTTAGLLTFTDSGTMGASDGVGIAMTLDSFGVNASSATFGAHLNRSTFTYQGFFQPVARTRAQIDVLVPSAVGQYVDCTDCTLPGLCRSTGTLVAQWRKIESSTLGCGTNN